MSEELNHLSHIGRVKLVSIDRQMEIVKELNTRFGVDGTDDSIFLFDAEISNDLLDSHFTHMNSKTLHNYAEDAQKGVAFLRGHDWKSLPIGYSVSGEVDETNSKQRVLAGFYTVRGLPDTDDLIARMKSGLVRDVSVGFYGGRAVCDLCGMDFWDCRHFPGLKYETKEGDTVKTELATFTIDDARLSEVSGVFDGSTPEAMILKAQRFAKAGELLPEQVQLLEQRYRIALPAKAKAIGTLFDIKERKMTEEQIEGLRAKLGVASEDLITQGVESLQRRVSELEPQAEEGRQYRKDLVAEALAEGVRAQGADFDSATYQTVLENAPLATVKRMRDDWKKVANAALPAGRSSVNDDQGTPKKAVTTVPDEAFA